MPLTFIEIRRAESQDAPTLTNIAFTAKRHWGYPERWIESWRDALTVLPEFIISHETYAALVEDRIVGFYALAPKNNRLELVHLWVLPEVMGQGVGRCRFVHALERTKALGFRALEIESDPNAEGFYLRMGARRVGTQLREADHQRRELPVLLCELGSDG